MGEIAPKISGYTPISHIGKGGFADVYLYQQTSPERKVAVKILRDLASREGKQAFLTESEILAKTSTHPSVVSLYSSGKLRDQRPYLVMQYCPVANLSSQVRRRPFQFDRALDTMIRLCGACEMVHRAGMVHRDIKPGNVLISEYGTPVLSDFGLALPINKPIRHRNIVGLSVPWAPPEQHRADSISHPSADVYSLAATMHSFLTGRSPFELVNGENTLATITQRVLQTPLVIADPRIPDSLAQILYWALDKDPQARPESARELGEALQGLQQSYNLPVTSMDVQEIRSSTLLNNGTDQDQTRMIGQISNFPGDNGGLSGGVSRDKRGRKNLTGVLDNSSSLANVSDVAGYSQNGAYQGLSRSRMRVAEASDEASKNKLALKLIAVAAGIVTCALLTSFLIYYFLTSADYRVGVSPEKKQELISGTANEVKEEGLSPITHLQGQVNGNQIELSWQPGPGATPDQYLVEIIVDEREKETQSVTENKASFPVEGKKWCAKISARGTKGNTSKSVEWCKE